MEKLVTIVKQLPLQERNYTDKNGQMQVFASVGFELTDGIDSFYAEIQGNDARVVPQYDLSVSHIVQCQMNARQFQDQQGRTRYDNVIRIIKMV